MFRAVRRVAEPLLPQRILFPLDHNNRLPQDPVFVKRKMRAPGAGQEGFAARGREKGKGKECRGGARLRSNAHLGHYARGRRLDFRSCGPQVGAYSAR